MNTYYRDAAEMAQHPDPTGGYTRHVESGGFAGGTEMWSEEGMRAVIALGRIQEQYAEALELALEGMAISDLCEAHGEPPHPNLDWKWSINDYAFDPMDPIESQFPHFLYDSFHADPGGFCLRLWARGFPGGGLLVQMEGAA